MNPLNFLKNYRSAMRPLAAATALLVTLFAGSAAVAQAVPEYVVSSQKTISPANPNGGNTSPCKALPGALNSLYGNIAVNSRGDLFIDGGGNCGNTNIVWEYPANGSTPIAIFTNATGQSYGASGVAVDSNDNLYVTNFYGAQGGGNPLDSRIYKFPFTNGSYPAPYVYSSQNPPGICNPFLPATPPTTANPNGTPEEPADTGVCSYGQYTQAAAYYWQPLNFAVDGLGNGYMYSNYDNYYNYKARGIFICNVACGQQSIASSANAKDLTTQLPGSDSITSFAADAIGNVYYVDGTAVFIVPINTPLPVAPVVFDKSYSNPTGITLDKQGNMYVNDDTGIYETPVTAGSATYAIDITKKFLLLPLTLPPQPSSGHTPSSQTSTAVDTRGNIYYTPSNPAVGSQSGTLLNKVQLWGGTFVPTALGATSTLTFTIAFDTATTLGPITAVQGSAAATEFTVAPGTCTAGAAFAVNQSCTFNVTFAPSAVGSRSGQVLVADGAGKTTISYVSGVGIGTGVTVDPGTANSIGTGLQTPAGLAVDAAGDVFTVDTAANAAYEFPAGGGAAVSIGSGLSVPTGIAVDAAGNVFIVNQGTAPYDSNNVGEGSVVEIPSVAGVPSTAGQTTVLSGLVLPTDIVIDGAGNFFISATNTTLATAGTPAFGSTPAVPPVPATNVATGVVLQYPNLSVSASNQQSSGVNLAVGVGLTTPTGIAVDDADNLYVADTGNDRVLQIVNGQSTSIGSGLTGPTGVAVDPSGGVYIVDQGSGRILRVPNEPGVATTANPTPSSVLTTSDQVLLDSPLLYPYAVRIDAAGNVYATDNSTTDPGITQLQRTTGTVDFGEWNTGTTSGPETLIVSSTGNKPLTLGSPLYAAPPAATGFTISPSTDADACTGTKLPAGDSCTLTAVFAPTAQGAENYPLVFDAPGLNTATPTLNLVGSGVSLDAAAFTIAVTSTGPLQYGSPFTIGAILTPSGNTPPPTGTVVFAFDNQNERPVTLPVPAVSPGVASITFPPGVQAGPHTVQALYEGDTNYASAESSVLNITLGLGTSTTTLTVIGDSSDPLSSALGNAFQMNVVLTPSGPGDFGGTVTFTDNGTVLATTTVFFDKGTKQYEAEYNTKTLPFGQHNIQAVYSGNANYSGSTSAVVLGTISNPTFTLTPNTALVTASGSTFGHVSVLVQSVAAFQGGVSFACTGLPANAYCVSRPDSVSLLSVAVVSGQPFTVPPVIVDLQFRVDQDANVVASSTSMGWIGAALAFALLLFSRRKFTGRGMALTSVLLVLALGGMVAMVGCGNNLGGGTFVTPPGVYPVTVTATGAGIVQGTIYPPDGTNPLSQVQYQTFQVRLTVK